MVVFGNRGLDFMMAAGIVARRRGRLQAGPLRWADESRDAEAADRGVLLGIGPGRQIDLLERARLIEIGKQVDRPTQLDFLRDIVDRSLGSVVPDGSTP